MVIIVDRAAAFYVGAAVKPSDRNESDSFRALPGCFFPWVGHGLARKTYLARGPVAIHDTGSFLRRRAQGASYDLLSVLASYPASHPMLFSLQGDLGSSSVYAPSNGRFLFETRRLAAGVSHQLDLLFYQGLASEGSLRLTVSSAPPLLGSLPSPDSATAQPAAGEPRPRSRSGAPGCFHSRSVLRTSG